MSFLGGETSSAVNGWRPINEYEPSQRGIVAQAKKLRGNRLLRDGDFTYHECPHCEVLLRVRRRRKGGPVLWCPCGYEIAATLMGQEVS